VITYGFVKWFSLATITQIVHQGIMKIADADILIIPGYQGSPAGHWQHNWANKMKTARIVEQDNWNKPGRGFSSVAMKLRSPLL